ncbi:MAG: hypothetical protein HC772_17670 [Leptolyngbyaceae cyanobacterium CRU_2_3]|nr:hypothetical protein [Leptolyngbyaceae cyanobacterium CRU_2_3]
MLTQEFDQQTERYLTDILSYENTTSDELLKSLIHDRWLSLQAELPAPYKRINHKQAIAEFIRRKYAQPVNREVFLAQ